MADENANMGNEEGQASSSLLPISSPAIETSASEMLDDKSSTTPNQCSRQPIDVTTSGGQIRTDLPCPEHNLVWKLGDPSAKYVNTATPKLSEEVLNLEERALNHFAVPSLR
jgi:hypothetical protein